MSLRDTIWPEVIAIVVMLIMLGVCIPLLVSEANKKLNTKPGHIDGTPLRHATINGHVYIYRYSGGGGIIHALHCPCLTNR